MKDSLGNELPRHKYGDCLSFFPEDLERIFKHNMAVLKTKLAVVDGKRVEYNAAEKTTTITDHNGQIETIKFP